VSPESFWQAFTRLSIWSFQALFVPPALIALAISSASLAVTFAWQLPIQKGTWRCSYWLVFTQLLFFPAIICVGVLLPAGGVMPRPIPNIAGHRWLEVLWYLSLGMSCFWVCWMKGVRWIGASLVALQQILILAAGFIAGMSVSGDWL
jgi:hypothetical protein